MYMHLPPGTSTASTTAGVGFKFGSAATTSAVTTTTSFGLQPSAGSLFGIGNDRQPQGEQYQKSRKSLDENSDSSLNDFPFISTQKQPTTALDIVQNALHGEIA
jgi:hypothetical protein